MLSDEQFVLKWIALSLGTIFSITLFVYVLVQFDAHLNFKREMLRTECGIESVEEN